MASIIRIKRSSVSGNPTTLAAGELAYSAYNGAGGNRLYIGMGTETAGNAANHHVIGGTYYTGLVDASVAGTLTTNASSIPVLSATGTIDQWLTGNLKLTSNTLSSTNTNGDINVTPNGTGKTVLTNPYIGDTSTSLAEYIYDTVGGAITAGTGISVSNSDAGNTSTVSLATSGVTAGSYGSASAIPSITIDVYGRVTAVSTNAISSSFTINGTSISLGGTATITAAAGTLTGTTLNSTVVSSSLTSVGTIATGVWNGTTVAVGYGGTGTSTGSITGTGALTFTAGGSNTNVNLVPQGTGTVDVASKRITSLADPTGAQDAATKAYVDAMQTGLDIKASVRAATTANITLSNTQTVDGVALSVGDRVLVKDQSTGSQNGVYIVASGAWTRATDCDNTPGTEVTSGLFTFVEEGTTNADTGWTLTTDGTITVGTTALTFVQFSGAGQITAGAALTKTGNTLDVAVDNSTIEVNSDALRIKTTYVGQTSITTLGTIATGTWQGTVIAGQYGGTGVNNSGKTITLGGNLTTSGAFATTLTVTGATTVTLPTTGTLATLAGSEALTNKTVNGLTITSTTGTLTVASGATLATSGAYSTTFTATGTTTLTLPTTGTLATLAGSESLSNKTITASSFAGSIAATTITASSTLGVTGAATFSSTVGITGAVTLSGNLTGAGAGTSTLDGFGIDGGTY